MSFPQDHPARRTFLRGLGASITLPAMTSLVRGAPTEATTKSRGTTETGAPLRAAYLYAPNGVIMDKWRPDGLGSEYTFNESMKSLADFKEDIQILKGFEHANGRGPAGDHARANATFLTGAVPLRTSGANIRLGVSADQLAAQYLSRETRLSSLELTCDRVRNAGACDAGYACAYQYNLSWRADHRPMTPESNPRSVFERLYGVGSPEERAANFARRHAEQRSILDFVRQSARKMEQQLGKEDRVKLDEYLTGVREVEQRIERFEKLGPPTDPGRPAPQPGAPRNYREHIRVLFDMMLLAFKSDSTRVISFLLGHDGSNRSFHSVGVSEGHHDLSHHGDEQARMDKVSLIDRFYLEELAYFLKQMREAKDADGNTLLHNSMVVWGSGLSDGNRHSHDDLPIIMAGNAGGRFTPGQHRDLGTTPLNNLFVRMLQELGLKGARFGDSTGPEKRV